MINNNGIIEYDAKNNIICPCCQIKVKIDDITEHNRTIDHIDRMKIYDYYEMVNKMDAKDKSQCYCCYTIIPNVDWNKHRDTNQHKINDIQYYLRVHNINISNKYLEY